MTIDTQIAKLAEQIEAEHSRFKAAVFTAVETVLESYGMSLADLTKAKIGVTLVEVKPKKTAKAVAELIDVAEKKAKAAKAKKAKAPVSKGTRPPKYRDPDSGATWSGMGHTPGWMASAKNRDAYLINGAG